mmetsp:Transcript_10365/g.23985  ORF Transcript_10365/g.23985 Transcript_10365/m.23985 type:complete len:384 (-) Transcript_10365:190-1341(-)
MVSRTALAEFLAFLLALSFPLTADCHMSSWSWLASLVTLSQNWRASWKDSCVAVLRVWPGEVYEWRTWSGTSPIPSAMRRAARLKPSRILSVTLGRLLPVTLSLRCSAEPSARSFMFSALSCMRSRPWWSLAEAVCLPVTRAAPDSAMSVAESTRSPTRSPAYSAASRAASLARCAPSTTWSLACSAVFLILSAVVGSPITLFLTRVATLCTELRIPPRGLPVTRSLASCMASPAASAVALALSLMVSHSSQASSDALPSVSEASLAREPVAEPTRPIALRTEPVALPTASLTAPLAFWYCSLAAPLALPVLSATAPLPSWTVSLAAFLASWYLSLAAFLMSCALSWAAFLVSWNLSWATLVASWRLSRTDSADSLVAASTVR